MSHRILLCLSLFLMVGWGSSCLAHIDTFVFDTPQDEQRFRKLSTELRCLVCQNQNLADSNADLAMDLRQEVYEMIKDGKSDADIIDFMVSRYGDFVLYRPPVKPITYLLWAGPLILLVIGAYALFVFVRHRSKEGVLQSGALDAEEQRRLSTLLEEKAVSTTPDPSTPERKK